jgi:hypothetical protein
LRTSRRKDAPNEGNRKPQLSDEPVARDTLRVYELIGVALEAVAAAGRNDSVENDATELFAAVGDDGADSVLVSPAQNRQVAACEQRSHAGSLDDAVCGPPADALRGEEKPGEPERAGRYDACGERQDEPTGHR